MPGRGWGDCTRFILKPSTTAEYSYVIELFDNIHFTAKERNVVDDVFIYCIGRNCHRYVMHYPLRKEMHINDLPDVRNELHRYEIDDVLELPTRLQLYLMHFIMMEKTR